MILPITTMLAGALALILVWLTINTITLRVKTDTSLGDGGNSALQTAIRSHGNFTEYTPLALILIGLLEFQNAPDLLVMALAGLLVVARLLHPLGLKAKAPNAPRAIGTIGTLTVLIVAALYALYMALG